MAFRLWHGVAKSQDEVAAMKPRWTYKELDSLDDALWWAMQSNNKGVRIAWEIEGDDGSRLDRQEIVMVRQRKHDLIANPPKKY